MAPSRPSQKGVTLNGDPESVESSILHFRLPHAPIPFLLPLNMFPYLLIIQADCTHTVCLCPGVLPQCHFYELSCRQDTLIALFPPQKMSLHLRFWHVFSSTDILHCTDCGACLSVKNFSWASGDAYAGQHAYRKGEFYWYVRMARRATV
jgi:hypothetical protein